MRRALDHAAAHLPVSSPRDPPTSNPRDHPPVTHRRTAAPRPRSVIPVQRPGRWCSHLRPRWCACPPCARTSWRPAAARGTARPAWPGPPCSRACQSCLPPLLCCLLHKLPTRAEAVGRPRRRTIPLGGASSTSFVFCQNGRMRLLNSAQRALENCQQQIWRTQNNTLAPP
eukprot:scaffold31304_cov107-Isochrysis_galbana.AAC.2